MKEINVKGVIISNEQMEVYDWYEIDSTCPYDVLSQLSPHEDVKVIINSGGGSVFAGAEIYTALKSHTGKVIVEVHSLAGSSASIIMMGGSEVHISPVAQVMIHNVSMGNEGDYHDMEQAAEILKNANESLANAYVLKTGIAKEEVLAMMDKETWLSADKAVDLGFADKIMFQDEQKQFNPLTLTASINSGLLPQQAINKFTEMKNEKKQAELKAEQNKHMAILNLLKLKEIQ